MEAKQRMTFEEATAVHAKALHRVDGGQRNLTVSLAAVHAIAGDVLERTGWTVRELMEEHVRRNSTVTIARQDVSGPGAVGIDLD